MKAQPIDRKALLSTVTEKAILSSFLLQQENYVEKKGLEEYPVADKKIVRYSKRIFKSFQRELRKADDPKELRKLENELLRLTKPNGKEFLNS